jgi:3'(2'), 5'-bisphosphate nucleotidase
MNLLGLIETARQAALNAGKEILKIYNSDTFNVELKDDNSPLTKADKASHNQIVRSLEITGLPIFSEEGRNIPYNERSHWEYYWLVDPLDGTKEFIKRNGEFTVNIALVHKNKVIGGVVYVPVTGSLYWSLKGYGAFMSNGSESARPLKINPEMDVTSIVASRSHMSAETAEFISRYPDANTISMGSSLKFMLVAEGKAQLYPRFAPTMEWDTAAAQAIVEEAGGFVVNYPSLEPLTYNRENLLNGWFLVSYKRPE